jgi:hypothetical protein
MLTQDEREEFFRAELIGELRRVETMVRNAPNIDKKMYYLSAAYGVTARTYRYSFSKEVLISDLLLHGVYNMMLERITALKSGDQAIIPDPAALDLICDGLKDLADSFESGRDIFEPLKKIVVIGFSFTGPGNYLKEKGELKF